MVEGRTHVCGKRRRWRVERGERPTKRGDSWFFAKTIEVVFSESNSSGRALVDAWYSKRYTCFRKTPNRTVRMKKQSMGAKVRTREGNSPDCLLTSWNGFILSGKGRRSILTPRRWAWKQLSFDERVRAHWLSTPSPKMSRGSRNLRKQQITFF